MCSVLLQFVIPNLCSSEVMIAIHSFTEAISVCCAVSRNLGRLVKTASTKLIITAPTAFKLV